MIEEIKRRLERGEAVELECVDREGFLKDIRRIEVNEKIIDQGPLVVDYIDYDGDIGLVGGIGDIYHNVIVSEEFKYFRIKEESPYIEDNPTFNDLIDVVVQAYKDGFADEIILNDDISISTQAETYGVSKTDTNSFEVKETIEKINALYTETFVIEQDSDIQKLKGEPNISLANGNEFVAKKMKIGSNPRGMFAIGFIDIDGYEMTYSFFELKGATVTQKRG